MPGEFGRRQLAKPVQQQSEPVNGRPVWTLWAIVAAFLVLGFAFLRMTDVSLSRYWANGVGYPSQEKGLAQAEASGDRLLAVHRACRAASGSVKLPRALADTLDRLAGVRQGELEVLRSSAYLDCLMTDRRDRFCASRDDVGHLVEAVHTHLQLMGKVQEEWTISRSPYDPGLEPRPSSGTMPSAGLDPKLVDDLRALAASGYIRTEDFATGWFGSGVPRPVAVALEKVNVDHDACGRHQAP